MTFQQWLTKALKESSEQTIQRKGQFLFNSLHEYNKRLANKICGGEYDPFHNDEKIDIFIGYVYLNWENGEEGENGTLG